MPRARIGSVDQGRLRASGRQGSPLAWRDDNASAAVRP